MEAARRINACASRVTKAAGKSGPSYMIPLCRVDTPMVIRTNKQPPQPEPQPDLFSWCSAQEPEEVVDHHLPPLEGLTDEWLARILREPGTGYSRADAAREVVRRRLPEAGALLTEVVRRNLGFARQRSVPEVAVAIDGLAALGV